MNNIQLIGNVTKDIEFKTAGKTNVSNFSIAVKRRYPDQEGNPVTDFFNLVAFGKLAETINKYVHKGDKIAVQGELQNNNYTDKDGVKKIYTNIVVDEIEFLSIKKQESKEEIKLNKIDDDDLPF